MRRGEKGLWVAKIKLNKICLGRGEDPRRNG
jgi:hypothetical protein